MLTIPPELNYGTRFLALIVILHLCQTQTSEGFDHNHHEIARERIQGARRAEEWVLQYQCEKINTTNQSNTSYLHRLPFKNIWSNLMNESCNKEPDSWRYRYADEILPSFTLQISDKTIDERLANLLYITYLDNMFDISHTYFNWGDPVQDSRNELLVAGPEVNDADCLRDLELMNKQLEDFQAKIERLRSQDTLNDTSTLEERFIRLARVLDSFGRYESGSLDGHIRLFGDYHECTHTHLLGDNSSKELTPMRYCWANMKSDRDLHPFLKTRIRYAHETAPGLLSTAVCLPRSCHSKNLHSQKHTQLVQKLVNSQLVLPNSIYVRQHFEIDSIFCLVDPDSEYGRLPISGKLCLFFMGSWLLLCIMMTVLNNRSRPGQEKGKGRCLKLRLAHHLDLLQSWRDFTSDMRDVSADQTVNLATLNPIKFCASILCISFHSMFLIGSVATSAMQAVALTDTSALLQASMMTSVVVDTFFVLSGMLIVYISLIKLARYDERQANKSGIIVRESRARSLVAFSRQWIMLALNRYLRIVPLYALMFWFRRDVLTYIGFGPLWDHGLNKETMNGACLQEPWYTPFSFMASFVWLTKQCFMPAWSIALDILFGLLLPPVIILLRRRPRWAINGLLALIMGSILASIEAFTTAQPAGVRWELFDAKIAGAFTLFNSFNYLYAWPIYRVPSFLIGNLAGYFLAQYGKRAIGSLDQGVKSRGWPLWFTGPATKMSVMYIILHVITSIFSYDIKQAISPYHRLMSLYVVTFDRMVWSAANAIVFMRMVTDWRLNGVMLWFSNQIWLTLAKLSYPIIFVHWIFIIAYLGSQTGQSPFTAWNIFATFSAITLATLPTSLLVHIIFEQPFDNIIKKEILVS